MLLSYLLFQVRKKVSYIVFLLEILDHFVQVRQQSQIETDRTTYSLNSLYYLLKKAQGSSIKTSTISRNQRS